MRDVKSCTQCKIVKPLEHFHRASKTQDGYKHKCKSCCKAYKTSIAQRVTTYSAEYREANRELLREKARDYQNSKLVTDSSRAIDRKYSSNRRVSEKSATPNWITADQLESIKSIYSLAKGLELVDGIPREVDHIHPINSPFICGLNLPCNLRILESQTNRYKSNNFNPYVESELDQNNLQLWEV